MFIADTILESSELAVNKTRIKNKTQYAAKHIGFRPALLSLELITLQQPLAPVLFPQTPAPERGIVLMIHQPSRDRYC